MGGTTFQTIHIKDEGESAVCSKLTHRYSGTVTMVWLSETMSTVGAPWPYAPATTGTQKTQSTKSIFGWPSHIEYGV
jgi:hypothetical protein